jgi:HTH-type transcriptional regulator/antitoxin HigA
MNAILKEISALPVVSSNDTYQLLVSRFPLLPVISKDQNTKAMAFVLFLMDLLAKHEGELSESTEDTIAGYLQALGTLVKNYESEAYGVPKGSGLEALKFLMEINGLTQLSLENEIGKQPQVSRIINGERPLTRDHIEKLARRFNVSPALFF